MTKVNQAFAANRKRPSKPAAFEKPSRNCNLLERTVVVGR
jgi:hypothetical protein